MNSRLKNLNVHGKRVCFSQAHPDCQLPSIKTIIKQPLTLNVGKQTNE
jgi:hypothetical protein